MLRYIHLSFFLFSFYDIKWLLKGIERCRPDDIESFMTLGHHYNKIYFFKFHYRW